MQWLWRVMAPLWKQMTYHEIFIKKEQPQARASLIIPADGVPRRVQEGRGWVWQDGVNRSVFF